MIVKFSDVNHPSVLERVELDWDAFLTELAAEPAGDFLGTQRHPGWSPVTFDPPLRRKENVQQVYALVLDYDKQADFDRIAELWADSRGLLYTTKSHSPAADRARVVLPFTRGVTPDEYERIWEWGASMSLQISCPVDKQTKDASRFWYWPSKPPGGWRSQMLTGTVISPDRVLATLGAPLPLRLIKTPPSSVDRLRRARAYLAKMPAAVSGQSGHLTTWNAVSAMVVGFDLPATQARDLILSDYNPRCDPPWSDKEIEHKLASVEQRSTRDRGYLLTDRKRIMTTVEASNAAAPVSDELEVDWRKEIISNEKGKPRRGYHNVVAFISLHPDYRGQWTLNTKTNTPHLAGREVDDTIIGEVRADFDRKMGFAPAREDIIQAIRGAATARPFHPIQQYLRSVDWDGEPRLSAMASDFLGADSEIASVMVRKWMIGAAARALWPGCKLDTALMLVGDQGMLKSTFFAILGGDWHSDTHLDLSNKDSYDQIHRAWIYELSELENVVTGRAESRLKAWMTSTHDTYRAPYERIPTRRARDVAVCGTTNRRQFLTDDSGSRRFWIVSVAKRVPTTLLGDLRDQLWAEAVVAAESGEPWWLSAEMERAREEENEEFQEDDSWQTAISEWSTATTLSRITVKDVLSGPLQIEVGRQTKADQMRVARILRTTGWKRVRAGLTRDTYWVKEVRHAE